MHNSYRILLFVSLLLIFSKEDHVFAKERDTTIVDYFKANIKDFNKKAVNPFGKEFKIKSKDIEQTQARIWKLWQQANAAFEGFPVMRVSSPKTIEDYPVHRWELHEEDPMPFYFIRKGAKPEAGYPLFLNLHGSGPKKEEFSATLMWSLHYKDSPSAYFVPQIPSERRYRWWYQPVQFAWEKLFRISMADGLIDPNKMYIMGVSEGGYGSQRLGAFYADYLAGAGPMAGGEPLRNAPPLNYRNIAFSFQTGEFDHAFGRNKLTMAAKNSFDSLALVYPGQFNHRIEIQKGMGHGIDYMPTTPWLINFERNPQPEYVTWVNFPMHGRYRHGFYNIGIDKALNVAENEEFDRALFTMKADKKTNTVNLTVARTTPEGDRTSSDVEGEITLYLSGKLVDLNKKVEVLYNGKKVFNGKLVLSEKTLIESCALFGDPERLFPAKVKVTL